MVKMVESFGQTGVIVCDSYAKDLVSGKIPGKLRDTGLKMELTIPNNRELNQNAMSNVRSRIFHMYNKKPARKPANPYVAPSRRPAQQMSYTQVTQQATAQHAYQKPNSIAQASQPSLDMKQALQEQKDYMNKRLSDQDKKIEKVVQDTDKKFDTIEQRLNNYDRKHEVIEDKIKQHDDQLTEQQTKLSSIDEMNGTLSLLAKAFLPNSTSITKAITQVEQIKSQALTLVNNDKTQVAVYKPQGTKETHGEKWKTTITQSQESTDSDSNEEPQTLTIELKDTTETIKIDNTYETVLPKKLFMDKTTEIESIGESESSESESSTSSDDDKSDESSEATEKEDNTESESNKEIDFSNHTTVPPEAEQKESSQEYPKVEQITMKHSHHDKYNKLEIINDLKNMAGQEAVELWTREYRSRLRFCQGEAANQIPFATEACLPYTTYSEAIEYAKQQVSEKPLSRANTGTTLTPNTKNELNQSLSLSPRMLSKDLESPLASHCNTWLSIPATLTPMPKEAEQVVQTIEEDLRSSKKLTQTKTFFLRNKYKNVETLFDMVNGVLQQSLKHQPINLVPRESLSTYCQKELKDHHWWFIWRDRYYLAHILRPDIFGPVSRDMRSWLDSQETNFKKWGLGGTGLIDYTAMAKIKTTLCIRDLEYNDESFPVSIAHILQKSEGELLDMNQEICKIVRAQQPTEKQRRNIIEEAKVEETKYWDTWKEDEYQKTLKNPKIFSEPPENPDEYYSLEVTKKIERNEGSTGFFRWEIDEHYVDMQTGKVMFPNKQEKAPRPESLETPPKTQINENCDDEESIGSGVPSSVTSEPQARSPLSISSSDSDKSYIPPSAFTTKSRTDTDMHNDFNKATLLPKHKQTFDDESHYEENESVAGTSIMTGSTQEASVAEGSTHEDKKTPRENTPQLRRSNRLQAKTKPDEAKQLSQIKKKKGKTKKVHTPPIGSSPKSTKKTKTPAKITEFFKSHISPLVRKKPKASPEQKSSL